MKIGKLDLGQRPVMLAPMEDVTDPSFRLISNLHSTSRHLLIHEL